MRRFVLVDHSLRRLGGHHFPYAHSVLAAARRAGFQPVLATHRAFGERGAVPAGWRVHALFRRESYSRYTLDIQALAGDATRRRGGWLARWQALRAGRVRAAHAAAFAADCARLFAMEPVGPGDVVLFATTSELDFAGLGQFLATREPARSPDWHAQFHFGLYGGRDPGYATQQPGTAALRAVFERALGQARGHRLALHCTTPQLAAQYATLGVAPFGALPYPVDAAFAPREPATTLGPMRIACLGHSRREKGYGQLPGLVGALWNDWLAPGRARLVLQTHRGGQRRGFDRHVRQLSQARPAAPGAVAIDYAGFPLPLADYVRLLREADLGLLLYDPTRYYARCSGVLLEMQCAGVPVLVPAGSWLAEQIEPLNQRWFEECAASLPAALAAPAPQATAGGWKVEMPVPPGSAALLLAFEWESPARPGRYLRVAWRARGVDGAGGGAAGVHVLGARPGGGLVRLVVPVAPGTSAVELSLAAGWEAAGAAPPARLVHGQASAAELPAGAVGRALAEGADLPSAVDELLRHAAHYRERARAAAAACRQRQSADRVVEALLADTMQAAIAPARPTAA